jgi:hypothetical protein
MLGSVKSTRNARKLPASVWTCSSWAARIERRFSPILPSKFSLSLAIQVSPTPRGDLRSSHGSRNTPSRPKTSRPTTQSPSESTNHFSLWYAPALVLHSITKHCRVPHGSRRATRSSSPPRDRRRPTHFQSRGASKSPPLQLRLASRRFGAKVRAQRPSAHPSKVTAWCPRPGTLRTEEITPLPLPDSAVVLPPLAGGLPVPRSLLGGTPK